MRRLPDWRWRTFPVIAAFVFGALLASLIDRPDSDFALVVRVLLIVAAGYCVAHLFVGYVLVPRRRRPAAGSRARDEVELVYDDDPRPQRPTTND
jgi:hypothetical protein